MRDKHLVGVWMGEDDFLTLKARAAKNRMSMSEYVRRKLRQVPLHLTDEEEMAVRFALTLAKTQLRDGDPLMARLLVLAAAKLGIDMRRRVPKEGGQG